MMRQAKLVALGIVLLGTSGCLATAGGIVRTTTDAIFGSEPVTIEQVSDTAAALPAPWNTVAASLLGALAGGFGVNKRRKWLQADPKSAG